MYPHERLDNLFFGSGLLSTHDFLKAIFGDVQDCCRVRLIWPKDIGEPPLKSYGRSYEILINFDNTGYLEMLQEANDRGYNIFFMPQKASKILRGRSVSNDDVVDINCLWIDHDGPRPINPAPLFGEQVLNYLSHSTSANLVTQTSAGKYHAYWLIEPESISVRDYPVYTKALWSMLRPNFDIDESIKDPMHLDRMIGFKNTKAAANGFICELVHKRAVDPFRRFDLRKREDLLFMFGQAGRDNFFAHLCGNKDGLGFRAASIINNNLHDPLPQKDMERLKKQHTTWMKREDDKRVADHIVYVEDEDRFYNLSNMRFYKKKQLEEVFNKDVVYEIKNRPRDYTTTKQRIVFRPNNKFNQETEVNIFKDTRLHPNPQGDVSRFLKIIDANFIPEYKKIVLQFMNATVNLIERRLQWGLLVIGKKEGTGKSSLYHIMKEILGRDICNSINASKLRKEFNGFIKHKRLLNIEEVSLEDRYSFVEDIKTWFTDDLLEIEQKGIDVYYADNFCHLYITSNYPRPFSLAGESRRFAIVSTKDDAKSPLSLEEFNTFMETDLGAVRHYLSTIDMSDVNWTRAPDTRVKRDLLEASVSDWSLELSSIAEELIAAGPYCYPSFTLDRLHDKYPKVNKQTMLHALKAEHKFENLRDRNWRQITILHNGSNVNHMPYATNPFNTNTLEATEENRNLARECLRNELSKRFR